MTQVFSGKNSLDKVVLENEERASKYLQED